MTENNIKELLSECFIKLVASNGGFKVNKLSPDDGGIDVDMTYSYSRIKNGQTTYIDSGQYIQIQLKTTTEKQIERNKKYIKYRLRNLNYNKLVVRRNTNKNVPAFLAVIILPDDKDEWLSILSNHLKLKNHAYWYIPNHDDEEVIGKKNSTTEIEIPIANKFSIKTIQELFENYVPK